MLPHSEIENLEYFFNSLESDLGIRSLFSAMIDRAFLFHTEETIPWDYNGVLPKATSNPAESTDLLSLCWGRNIHDKSGGRVARGRRVRNALKKLQTEGNVGYVDLLYKLYGPPSPGTEQLRPLFSDTRTALVASLCDGWGVTLSAMQKPFLRVTKESETATARRRAKYDAARQAALATLEAEALALIEEAESAYLGALV